jgi:Zn finger protein HypA/HybF involved in hydrogenase expression
MKRRFLCKKCWNIFDLSDVDDSSSNLEIRCPKCCSADITEAPPWAPLDSGRNIFESDVWQYECQQCLHKFKMPIPKSPAEDKSRKCPACHSDHLHLITGAKTLPLYCG